jgi:hypothetical protein
MRRIWILLCLISCACGDSSHAHPDDESADAGSAAGDGDQDDEDSSFEGCPADTPPFALGMQAEGMLGHITGSLISASNVPPLRFLNDWTVEFVDGMGAPIEDVSIRTARPFMPVHGHDGNVKPTVSAEGPGRFAIKSLNLNMRGPWEIQFQLRSASAGDDYVVFHICVQE